MRETADRGVEPAPDGDATRIPRLLPSRAVFSDDRAAHSLLGLLATHADKQLPELSPEDRTKTRERIMRSLHVHCQGDYEKLLLLLSSMEEELLHIKTTSSEFYAQQAFELSDLIAHATLER
ncbi:hypothetical protein BBO99_00006386 [Phytophthora kernoviae]|uniref:Uncharacterized protein n=2 Tax=Phytophthora kernoviae TaxID=325452 RepID=A0A3R7JWI4_9STRA|nr:hypothetical protein G195_007274 [Phytophthora kernoviae 00238/432]KAG2516726.1 hypothetical protein JM16_007585 [Phytophthora kernoviae]KAG2519297.1 hypothetical protein JM18_007598 [Phytophthora kernoviae]RLN26550.1 hypothetical protein BBI17_006423 [Phytophthora kernoviae]RLN77906.1 hypothetical protein BBO99_00006386 [Phytophthora kernoviae]